MRNNSDFLGSRKQLEIFTLELIGIEFSLYKYSHNKQFPQNILIL